MDAKTKEVIDNYFAKHEGNAVCIDMFRNIDYGDRAKQAYWTEHIEDISHTMKLEQNYEDGTLPKTITFTNFGLNEDDVTEEDINAVDEVCNAVLPYVDWDEHDFDGEVNQYWYGFVIVTNDYRVLEVTSTGEHDVLYRKTLGDLTKFGSANEEIEKQALKNIKSAVADIKATIKDVKSNDGKAALRKLLAKLQ